MSRPVILVVENDPSVQSALSKALEQEGYDVTAHSSLNSALDFLQRTEAPLDGAIVQTASADADRLQPLKKLLRTRPFLPILLTTEGQNPDLASMAVRAGAAGVIQKPFSRTRLLAVLYAAIYNPNEWSAPLIGTPESDEETVPGMK